MGSKDSLKVSRASELPAAFKNRFLCLTHVLYLEALCEYLDRGGKSRGSYLVVDPEGKKACPQLDREWSFKLNSPRDFVENKILEIIYRGDGKVEKKWADIRPLPRDTAWFENVWNAFLSDKIID
jgi:hypothetical protein